MDLQGSDLRYIAADHVETPAGHLGDTMVVSASKGTLGKLDGIVFDLMRRDVRGYVVQSPGLLWSRRYLVPPVPARLDRNRRALEVDLDDEVTNLDEVKPHTFHRFSDDDLIAALMHSPHGD